MNGTSSNVHAHSKKLGHKIDWDNIKILDKASDNMKLELKEMLHINKNKPGMNVQKKSYVFSMIIGNNKDLK